MHCEIERKYLIRMPDCAALRGMEGCEVWDIEQIYLCAEPGCTRRIRRVAENGGERWYRTVKRRLTDAACEEDEGEIAKAEYDRLRQEADPRLKPIVKTRYRVPYAGQVLEVDVYPFWRDRAILEIELESEAQPVVMPDWIELVREVTEDKRYKNVRLAREVPNDAI